MAVTAVIIAVPTVLVLLANRRTDTVAHLITATKTVVVIVVAISVAAASVWELTVLVTPRRTAGSVSKAIAPKSVVVITEPTVAELAFAKGVPQNNGLARFSVSPTPATINP
jgi:hypothetical protein